MNILDILIGIPLVLSMIKGFSRGFIYEITSLIALILGIYVAINFSGLTAAFLADIFHWSGRGAWLASLLITFAVVVMGIKLLGQIMEKVVETLAMGPLNHLAGGIVAGLKTALILSLFIYLINLFDFNRTLISAKTRENSLMWNPVSEVAPFILPQLEKKIEGLKDKKEK